MPLARLALPLALLAAPAFAALPDAAAPEGCAPEAVQQAWNDGYVRGVEDIKAQLARATQQMQQQVQDQLNAQLAQLQQQRDSDLQTRLRSAQQEALQRAVTTPMPSALTGGGRAAASNPAPPSGEGSASGVPDDPSALPPGSRLVIENAETLPPDLYAALMAYLKR